MYTSTNFKTKKEFKAAIESGRKISVYQPGPFGSGDVESGKFAIEGPHYPQPHKWYATAIVVDGYVVKVS